MLGKQCATELYPQLASGFKKKIKVPTTKSKIFKIIEGKRSEPEYKQNKTTHELAIPEARQQNIGFCVLIYSKFSITQGFLKEAK